MRFLRDKHGFSLALIIAILLLLPALAIMQYRWVGQVSDAEHARLPRGREDVEDVAHLHISEASLEHRRAGIHRIER